MITDYSSVFQDFLNANKPIGLCWEDFEEFNKREGFDIDINPIRAAGEMVNSIHDLERFVTNTSEDRDEKKSQRQKLNLLVNPYQDGYASERMADYIEAWLSKQYK